jgi:hypothetical protein
MQIPTFTPERLRQHRINLIRALVAHCPHCGKNAPEAVGVARIYRMSNTAVTLQCPNCWVQWSITFHMLARMARHVAEHGGDVQPASDYRYAAELFAVPETRRPVRRPTGYDVLKPPEPPEGGSVG